MYTFTLKINNEIKVLKADLLIDMAEHFIREGYEVVSVTRTQSGIDVTHKVHEIENNIKDEMNLIHAAQFEVYCDEMYERCTY